MKQLNSDRSTNSNNDRQLSADSKINSLLQAVADCASALLSGGNFESGVNEALEILGTSTGADRIGIGEQHNDPTEKTLGYVVATHEWLSPHANSQLYHPKLSRINCEEFTEDYYKLISGQHCGGHIKTYLEPFRSEQEELGVKATYAIPIMIRGQYWGIIGLDFCQTAKELCDAQIAVLKTAATCIGSAIQKERSRQEKEAAERKALLQQQKTVELQKRGNEVQRSERLLNVTAEVARALLNDGNLETAIALALQIVGRGIDTDRVCVMEHYDDPEGKSLGYVKMLYEWNSPHAISQLQHPELHQLSYEGTEDWYEKLTRGEAVGGKIEELPEAVRTAQIELGVKSMYSVPIMVEGKYWGIVGFDRCREAKQHSESEISILKATAACIGSAIQQSRIRDSREQAEREALLEKEKVVQLAKHNQVLEKRDRILAATAEASNCLLSEDNFDDAVNKALQIIGESIDTDRVGILEHIEDPSEQSLGYVQVIYEWDSTFAVSQINHPEVSQVSFEGIEEWYFLSCKGESTGGVLDELPEPFRSKMAKIGVKATYGIPIMVNSQLWGIIGVDDCREKTRRSEAELSILKTAAACIGGAIQHERIRRAKEEAERNILLERARSAIEKTDRLAKHNQVLEKRDRILAATAEASNYLLSEDNFEKAVNKALKIIGQTIDVDRVLVIEHWHNASKPLIPHWRILYEWNSDRVISQLSKPRLRVGSYQGIEEWYEILGNGQTISRRLEDIHEPFRSIKAEIGVKILHVIPIFVEGTYWGVLAINDCTKVKYLSEAELNIFKTSANCIGGAIQQERIRCAKEEAERNVLVEKERSATEKAKQLQESNQILSLREKWLEATANAANKLLEIADLDEGINTALKVLGESLNCDRIGVMQYFEGDLSVSSPFVYQSYEWNSAGTISQIDHPQLYKISNIGMEENFAKVISGEWIGGMIEEFPEPFRSGQIELGVKSTYAVPIFVGNRFWGIVGIDRCREPRRLTSAEIAVFKTAASCIGSAIYRQQIQQEKEQAELAVLDERNRMAREIHDTLAQAFTGISLQLEVAKSILSTESEAVRERLLLAKHLAEEGIAEARRSVRALRPEVLESGLIVALQQLIDKMVSGTDIKAEVIIEGEPYSLDSVIEVKLFRISQEAITNILRHARASKIYVQLIYEVDTTHLQIKDNGVGFDLQSLQNEGFGLIGMRERSDRLDGNLVINSATGRGTEIIVTVVTN